MPSAVSHLGPTPSTQNPHLAPQCQPPSAWGFRWHPVLGRGDDVADLCSRLGALCIAAARSMAPSGMQGSRASLCPMTGCRQRQSTMSGTTGANTTNQPVSGAPSAPLSSYIPRHQTKQRTRSDGDTSSKAARWDGGVLDSPPSSPTSLVSNTQRSVATKTTSSPAQRRIRCKRAATCNTPSSATSQPTADAPVLAIAAQVRGTMSHAGPNSQHQGPRTGTTMPAPISMGLSAVPTVLGSGDNVADLCSKFGAHCIIAATSKAPSGPQGSRASLGPNTGAANARAPCWGLREPAQRTSLCREP
uniref:Uncharacterized protein n=1 Tax=Mustela putorius furo TaxID=9669 RepID=M3YEC6_MUSPF